ncbi:HFL157Wp [Eremothecium sinecaudum]|uniref:HFL157Wp n=1 Tax=Eremothecium sinecaudum TaxID=45286 RepID=A0A0X8HUK3_9SACH|nr:HFL157Wp [Eremothecium sinecaudum]AMD21699.1 HFL157Wp [Eremothecium sinecaudum]
MDDPKAKKSVSLQSLLSGYSKKDKKGSKIEQKSTPSVESRSNTSTEQSADEIEESTIDPELLFTDPTDELCILGDKSRKRSLTDLIMTEKPHEVITINDDEDVQLSDYRTAESVRDVNVKSLKDVLTGAYGKKRKTVVDKEKTVQQAQEELLKSFTNTRKIILKDLFVQYQSADKNHADGEESKGVSPQHKCKRLNDISKLTEVNAPWPKHQNISDSEVLLHKPLFLTPKKVGLFEDPKFVISEYASLNNKNDDNGVQKYTVEYEDGFKPSKTIWTETFKPNEIEDVMIATKVKNSVRTWIESAFNKLKKPTDRSLLYQRGINSVEDEFKDFIIDEGSDEIDGNYDRLERFVPLMILAGETGKFTLLEVIMNDIGGEIFEINSSSNRGRKNIWENIKEFSTTHFVKNTGSYGLIVFDDADIIFNERDKFFWSAVEKTLCISRRPIVLTCRDVNNLPSNFVQLAKEQGSLFQVKKVKVDAILKYLETCTKKLNIKISDNVLRQIIEGSNRDIRSCILQLQYLCTAPGHISEKVTKTETKSYTQLIEYIRDIESLSVADILEARTWNRSFIPDDVDESLINSKCTSVRYQSEEESMRRDYLLDYRTHLVDSLHSPLKSFELNIAKYLQKKLTHRPEQHLRNVKRFYRTFTYEAIKFLSSSIVRNSNGYASSRLTRSAKRTNYLMDPGRRQTTEEADCSDAYFDFISTHTVRQVSRDIMPFFHVFATISQQTRSHNMALYKQRNAAMNPEGKLGTDDIVADLLQKGLLKKLYFSSSPDRVIELWEQQECT